MQCKEWDDANSELFKESHDEAVHKNSYKSRLYDLISASLKSALRDCLPALIVILTPGEDDKREAGLPSPQSILPV